MDVSEGVARIAKLISAAGWVASSAIAVGLLASIRHLDEEWFAFFILSLAIWVGAQALVWIIDGFAGNKGDKSNIIWPSTILDYWVSWQTGRNSRNE